jgi:hypothetical protein
LKVSQQFAFSGAAGLAVSSIPSTSRGVESKVSQQFAFSGAAGCAVPSLSHVQVELLKVKYPNSLLLLVQ